MTPTLKLRFVERTLPYPEAKTIRVLQQWWENKNIVLAIHVEDKDGNPLPPPAHGEWRDVPLEVET